MGWSSNHSQVKLSERKARECARVILEAHQVLASWVNQAVGSRTLIALSDERAHLLRYIAAQPTASVAHTAHHVGRSSATVSLMVDGLVRRGWLDRSHGTSDRRVKELRITSAGRQVLRRWTDHRERQVAKSCARSAPHDIRALLRLCAHVQVLNTSMKGTRDGRGSAP